nr:restriction endonuclease subunit S [Sporolactobacillus kofuensis]
MSQGKTNSVVDWLGDIPSSWELIRLRFLCCIGTGSKDTVDNVINGKYPFFVRSDNVEKIDEFTHDEEAVMTAGDGVGVGRVFHYYKGKFAAHQRVYVFTKFNNCKAKFIYYYLKSNLAFEVLKGNAKSTVDSLRRPMLANFLVSLPSFNEQESIIRFLDDKTSEIDSLIAAKKKLIDLLEEQRQAIITEAVTKGLDPNVKMKDSGVEWIGEIPEHWNLLRIKYLGDAILGLTYSPSDVVSKNEGKLVLRSSNIRNGKIDYNDTVYVNCAVPPKLITKEHDILICSRNGSRELIGKCALIDRNSQDQTFGAFTTVFRSEINEFLFYIFQSQLFKSQIGSYLTSTINQLTISKLRNFPVAIPNDLERKKITNFLQKKALEFDSIIKNEKNAIDNLKEYRQSLIYEAVTGKIDVRDYKKEEALS